MCARRGPAALRVGSVSLSRERLVLDVEQERALAVLEGPDAIVQAAVRLELEAHEERDELALLVPGAELPLPARQLEAPLAARHASQIRHGVGARAGRGLLHRIGVRTLALRSEASAEGGDEGQGDEASRCCMLGRWAWDTNGSRHCPACRCRCNELQPARSPAPRHTRGQAISGVAASPRSRSTIFEDLRSTRQRVDPVQAPVRNSRMPACNNERIEASQSPAQPVGCCCSQE